MSQYWDIPDVFGSDSRRDTTSSVTTTTTTTNEDDKWMERNFIILLTRIEQVSPSMAYPLKHRDTMPMRPVVSTPLHLSICRTIGCFREKKKKERGRDAFFFKSPFAAIDSSPSPRAARWFPGIRRVAGSFLRKRGDPEASNTEYRPICRTYQSWEIENPVISWMIEILGLYLASRSSLDIFFFSEHACTHARALPTRGLSQFFYRRVLFGVLSRVYVPAEFDGLSRRRFNACINFSGITANRTRRIFSSWHSGWKITKYSAKFVRESCVFS